MTAARLGYNQARRPPDGNGIGKRPGPKGMRSYRKKNPHLRRNRARAAHIVLEAALSSYSRPLLVIVTTLSPVKLTGRDTITVIRQKIEVTLSGTCDCNAARRGARG
jgi:hypothetical protein